MYPRISLMLFMVATSGCHAVRDHRVAHRASSYWPLCAELQRGRFVDLTHAFDENIPHFAAFPRMTVKDLFHIEPDGFWAQEFTHVGQWGTHVDPPAHFHEGLATVDQIPVTQMVLPLVVIDVHERAAENPDYALTLADVKAWEADHGPVPVGAFVALRTDWSKRWPDAKSMRHADDRDVAHYPGWTLEALRYLYEDRKITASGHETTDTDPGVSTSRGRFDCESYILGRNHYQIELLANLDDVPPTGAIAICTFPKPKNGSGFPARVFAIVPQAVDR
ncbi:MAG: cyclase family protein [Planctomycetota bacterium]|jgi:kynurenine formamidase